MSDRTVSARRAWVWVALTVLIYLASLVLLMPSLWAWAFLEKANGDVSEGLRVLREPGYWAVIGGLTLLQMLVLVLVPMPISRGRPVSRGRWVWLAITSALLLGVLAAAFGYVVMEAMDLEGNAGDEIAWVPLALGGGVWVAWTVIFALYRGRVGEVIGLRRIVDRWLAGSVAELAVAVPCHIYVRRRDDCCAGILTFVGLSTGLAVLSFALGPALFLLFATRLERLRRAQDATDVHARDALVYFFGSQLFLLAGLVWAVVLRSAAGWSYLAAMVGAAVFHATAVLHAVRALRGMGMSLTAVLAAGVILLEAVALVLWIWQV